MQSLSGYSVYDGWQVQGWPKFVIRRGQLVLADGQITARPGDGEWLRRTTTAPALPSRPRRPLPPGFTQAHNYAYTASGHSCAQLQLRPRSACFATLDPVRGMTERSRNLRFGSPQENANMGGARRSAGRGDDPVLVDLAVDRRPGHAQ